MSITLAKHIKTYTFARLYMIVTILEASDIADMILELSEREIYNDIRSECDITEILTIRPDATPEFFDSYKASAWAEPVLAHSTLDITAYAEEGYSYITWQDVVSYGFSPETILGLTEAECLALDSDAEWRQFASGPSMCLLTQGLVKGDMSWEIINRGDTTCTLRITNDSDYDVRGVWYISYLALSSERRFVKYRSIDETSIAKYGRRVMNLMWPLGQHPNTMQQMIADYLDRYKDAVPILTATIQGKTDRLASFVLNAKINDVVRIRHDGLGIDHDFWVNQLAPSHRTDGLLEGDFQLEQIRTSEQLTLFEWDTSVWDGGGVWAP